MLKNERSLNCLKIWALEILLFISFLEKKLPKQKKLDFKTQWV